MINKELYFKQAEAIALDKEITKEDYIILFNIVSGRESQVNAAFIADKIITELFGTLYNEPLVPWSFYNTEIGKAILQAKFNIGIVFYNVAELCELTGYSKQYIGKEIKRENIKAEIHGKKTFFFREDDVNDYLKKKGLKTIYERNENIYTEEKERIAKENSL